MPYVSCTKLETEVATLNAAIDGKQDQLKNTGGTDLAGGSCVMTCAEVNAAIAAAAPNGSETKINAGAGISVSGSGTSAAPYVIASTLAVDGSETKLSAGTNVAVSGSGTTASPYSIAVADATDAVKGAVELATTAEAAAGTSTTLAVTPAGLKNAVDTAVNAAKLTDCSGTTLAGGTSVLTCPTTAGTTGQVLTKQADGSAAWATPATGGGGITSVSHDATMTGDGNATPLSVVSATDSVKGIVELATTAEATTGTSTTLAVTPAGLKAAVDAAKLTDCSGTTLAGGASVLTCPTAAGTTGQVLTKQADGSAAWATPSGGGGSSFSLVDCAGAAIASGGSVPSCTEFNFRVPSGGTTGQVLTKQADGSGAWQSAPVGVPASIDAVGSVVEAMWTNTPPVNGDTWLNKGDTVSGSMLRINYDSIMSNALYYPRVVPHDGVVTLGGGGIPDPFPAGGTTLSGTWRVIKKPVNRAYDADGWVTTYVPGWFVRIA